jgi:hypothetical protein
MLHGGLDLPGGMRAALGPVLGEAGIAAHVMSDQHTLSERLGGLRVKTSEGQGATWHGEGR